MALFDKSANDYDGWYNSPMGRYVDEAETKCMFSLSDELSGKAVLDIGCGTGHLSEKLNALGASVTGIDISGGMLSKAKQSAERQNLNIQYKNMNVCALEFEDASFDCAFSMAAFEFIKDTSAAFKSIRRIFKPNGTIVIGTIHNGSAWADMYKSEAFSDTVFANSEFKKLSDFEAIDGFSVIESKECLFVPPGLDEECYTMENEHIEQANGRKGGFLCVKMKRL